MLANPENHPDSSTRACNKCGTEYPRTPEFWNLQKRHVDGLEEVCKRCASSRSREWYAANRERARAQGKQYRDSNRERVLEGKLRYRAANKERVKSGVDAWKSANRGRISEWGKQYRAANAAAIAEKKRADYLANPEIAKQRAREWVQANPERVSMRTARRRAAFKNAPGVFTEDDLIRQFEKQQGECFYCHRDLAGQGTIDHYIPLSKGGTNWPDNIVLACWPCNNAKRAKLPSEFRPQV